MSVKCVILGDIHGKFKDVFTKLGPLQAKNNFSFAIIAGELFSNTAAQSSVDDPDLEQLLAGNIKVPLPTYFSLGKLPLRQSVTSKLDSNNAELCENLIFLGKRTTIKTSEGIRIVALGGALDTTLDTAASKDRYTPFHSTGDTKTLRGATTADILITSSWPSNILKGSRTPPENLTPNDPQDTIADLCAHLKPRYHFTTSPTHFYEREPFFHPPPPDFDANTGHKITRFIALAPYGNPTKQKWIYAFSLDPSASDPITIPQGTTASPLSFLANKRGIPANSKLPQPAEYTRYDTSTTSYSDGSGRANKRRKGARHPPPGPEECFFCLSNPALSTHLITSIGAYSYMTTAKGPLSTSATFADRGLDVPGHMLVIPLQHHGALGLVQPGEERKETVGEMWRFRGAVKGMVGRVSEGRLGCVSWMVERAEGVHVHLQVLPVGVEMVEKGLVEAAFKVEARNEGWPAFEVEDVGVDENENEQVEVGGGDKFVVWISGAEAGSRGQKTENGQTLNGASDGNSSTRKERRLTLSLSSDFRFDLNFGRRVMAKLLGLEKRLNWRDCAQSTEDETGDAERWKETFKAWDFTIED